MRKVAITLKMLQGIALLALVALGCRVADAQTVSGAAGSDISSMPQPISPVNSPSVYFIQTDQLNTPRVITDENRGVVWRWDGDAFGVQPPDNTPTGETPFVFNLRFPGQAFDNETGLYYNYFRDYDPQTGRYVQSDPLGLGGGLNTYGYVGGNPLSFSDSTGLIPNPAELACAAGPNPVCIGGVAVDVGSWALAGLGTTAAIAAVATPGDTTKAATSVEEFCSKCKATASRSQAQAQAWAWAGITPGGAGTTPKLWKPDFNPPGGSSFFKTRVWASFSQQYPGSNFGYSAVSGSVEEHPFGHPDLPGGQNHDCPHFMARNSKGATMEFPYKPGSN